MAEKSGIKRPQFIQHWAGSELLTQWPGEDVNTKAWEKLMTKYEKEVTEIRKDIAQMMTEIDHEAVPEFKELVQVGSTYDEREAARAPKKKWSKPICV